MGKLQGKLQGKIISIDQQFFVIFLGSSCFHLLPAGWHFHSQWTDPIGVPLGSGNSFQRLRAWFNSMRSDQFGCVDITQVPVARWWAAESASCELWIQGI